jgi:RND family efflux transporter MFP subunit
MTRQIAVIFAVLGLASCSPGAAEDGADREGARATAVRVGTASRKTVHQGIRAPITIEPAMRATITPQVGGVLTAVFKDTGDTVEEGERLLEIAATDYRLALDQARSGLAGAEAGVAQAKAAYENAKIQYERYEKLRASNAITEAAFEKVRTGYQAAKAGYDAAQSQLRAAGTGIRSARKRVSDTVITAPFPGYVVARHMDPGELVRPMGAPILIISNIDHVFAVAAVGELDSARLKIGSEAEVVLDALPDRRFSGKLVMINQEVDAMTRTVEVKIRLDNPEHEIKGGMAGTVEIRLGTQDAVVVPRTALVRRRGHKARTFVVEGDVVRQREVTLADSLGEDVPVVEGLQGGEQIVIWGGVNLADGNRITVLEQVDAAEAEEGGQS